MLLLASYGYKMVPVFKVVFSASVVWSMLVLDNSDLVNNITTLLRTKNNISELLEHAHSHSINKYRHPCNSHAELFIIRLSRWGSGA